MLRGMPFRVPSRTIAAGFVAATETTGLAIGYVRIRTGDWTGLGSAELGLLQMTLGVSVVWSGVLIVGLLRSRRWVGWAALATLTVVAGCSAWAMVDTAKRVRGSPSAPDRHLVAPVALTAWSVGGVVFLSRPGSRAELLNRLDGAEPI